MRPLSNRRLRPGTAGFSMIELMISIAVLFVGVVAVAQLVPKAIRTDFVNRYDSSALIFVQRQLDQMAAQDMSAGNPAVNGTYFYTARLPINGTNVAGGGNTFTCNLGQAPPILTIPPPPTTPPALPPAPTQVGAPLLAGSLQIDWTQAFGAVPANYGVQFRTTGGYFYEARWNVTTFFANINGLIQPAGKRIVISMRGGPQGVGREPATIMTTVGWE